MKNCPHLFAPAISVAGAGRLLAAGLACALAACASAPPQWTDFPVDVKAMPLDITEVSGSTDALFVGGYLLESSRPEFGGFSGLVVEEGRRLIAVSDRGFWWENPLSLAPSGQIRLAERGRMGPLYDFGGKIAERGSDRHDAEELAGWPGGQLVSFEGEHRIAFYRRRLAPRRGIPPIASRRPRRFAIPPEIDLVKFENGGIEAMTRLADGRLAVFSEEQRDAEGRGLLWVGDPRRGAWHGLRLAMFEDYVPTSATTLPGGDVLLLERSYSENRGVRGRVLRLPAADFASNADPARPIAGREILRIEPPESVDNFEGIEVVPLEDGRIFFLLLSDDNFNDMQRILLLQFELLAP